MAIPREKKQKDVRRIQLGGDAGMTIIVVALKRTEVLSYP
jgi:hypothetical protein